MNFYQADLVNRAMEDIGAESVIDNLNFITWRGVYHIGDSTVDFIGETPMPRLIIYARDEETALRDLREVIAAMKKYAPEGYDLDKITEILDGKSQPVTLPQQTA